LGACGGDSESSTTTTGPEGTTTTTIVRTSNLDDVKVSADTAVAPVVEFEPSFAGSEPQSRVVTEGTGETVAADQRVGLDYVVISGVDGTELETTWGKKPEVVALDDQLQASILSALVGQKVGSRVTASLDTGAAAAAAGQPTEGSQWVIFVFDIRSATTVPTRAEGEAVTPPDGLPTVTEVDGTPTITLPGTPPPTTLVVQPLIKGAGPAVEEGQTVTVQYVGVKWSDGQIFDSSWQNGKPIDFVVATGQVIAGFAEGLIGQTVGSRVLLVIPPDKGYGPQGNSQAGISGTETLVFVVDILAAA
jgi:peptidylprolyl isomerase